MNTRDYIDQRIDELRQEMRQYVDNRLQQMHKHVNDTAGKQLALSKKEIGKEIQVVLNNEIMPKINSFVEYAQYTMTDGDELVTEYRKELWEATSQGQITDGNDAASFQQRTFFFTDNDDDEVDYEWIKQMQKSNLDKEGYFVDKRAERPQIPGAKKQPQRPTKQPRMNNPRMPPKGAPRSNMPVFRDDFSGPSANPTHRSMDNGRA